MGGRPLDLEVISYGSGVDHQIMLFMEDAAKLGVRISIRMMDTAKYATVLRSRDYDLMLDYNQFAPVPSAVALKSVFSSEMADDPDNTDTFQIHNAVVDALVKLYAESTSLEQKVPIARALDRVLLSEHYLIPIGYNSRARVAYWPDLHHPEKPPPSWFPVTQTWWHDQP